MNLPLAGPRARGLLLLCGCALAFALSFLSIRNARATYDLDRDTREGYERAVQLEPQNARNWYLLGRSYLYDLEQPDATRAVRALQKAVELDPYSAEAMLDLAEAYDSEGDTSSARAAFVSAQRVYPLSADVAWSYGNFLFRQGDENGGFAQLHKALELDPKRAAEAFSRAARQEPDANVVLDKVVPPSAQTYVPILDILSDSSDLDTAQLVWNRLVALHTTVPLPDLIPFFDGLIRVRRPGDAAALWLQAAAIMTNPPPPDPPGSILWDGGFESGYSGGGFSWQFSRVSRDAQISFDSSEKHSGEKSLRILFNGRENIQFEDACHPFVPEPGKHYLLTGWAKTEALTSSDGVRLGIFAFSGHGNVSATSDDIHGTQPWTQLRLSWTAPEDSGFGKVCVRRNMSALPNSHIQGAVWLDDVAMIPEDTPKIGAKRRP